MKWSFSLRSKPGRLHGIAGLRGAIARGGIKRFNHAWDIAEEAARIAPFGDNHEIICEKIAELLVILFYETNSENFGTDVKSTLNNLVDLIEQYQ